MDLQTLRINGKSANSHDTCNVLLTFECVEPSYDEQLAGDEAYVVLHRVQLEPTTYSALRIDVPLDDSDAREHFESLLSVNFHGYPVRAEEIA